MEIKDSDFKQQITKDKNRFVADYLSKKTLSTDSANVFEKARLVYKLFYKNLNLMATKEWKIDFWDTGWNQIRRCLAEYNIATEELKDLSIANENLASIILPKIEEYGFLDKYDL
ncbi:hypothetical protein [Leptospira jelokensis]|uniref:hypothetical protein n=1 Tax=Leptospira jelokensis TaxID=2484931 RepID=UPI0010912B98|nr:hypothetical protein [Leptospira jelokensis]TGM03231.1 hypothetical protein EHQ79_06610 [Leptospira jelokensis]